MIGIDIDEEALKVAESKYNMKVLQTDINYSVPFENNSFDFVVAGELLEHLPIPIVILSEIHRVPERWQFIFYW